MTTTGYESYSRPQLDTMVKDIESNLRQERWASDGTGLRAEIARSAVREFERQLAKIRLTIQQS